MRVQPKKAGYQVTFFAHVCIQLETLRLLNNDCIRVCYEADTIKQTVKAIAKRSKRQMLAGQEELQRSRFVMCNKDMNICVSVKEPHREQQLNSSLPGEDERREPSMPHLQQDYFGQKADARISQGSNANGEGDYELRKAKTIYYSPALDIKQAGKLTDFAVRTESAELQRARRQQKLQQRQIRYDFSMSNTLALADAEDFIFTKIIVVSPRYVLVNQMGSPIEVA